MKEHILLHVCCGPCSLVPIQRLRAQGHMVTAFFSNPNIHPLQEYLRRREALIECAQKLDFSIIFDDAHWDISAWLAAVAGVKDTSPTRCGYCYETRLEATAQKIKYVSEIKSENFLEKNTEKKLDILQDLKSEPSTTMQFHFTSFSSSLFYSRYQDHEQMKSIAEKISQKYSVPFYYEDFRDGWQKGIDMAKELGIYRQAYCGCIYSEAERYAKNLAKCKAQSENS